MGRVDIPKMWGQTQLPPCLWPLILGMPHTGSLPYT
jgi:hypothetical protein